MAVILLAHDQVKRYDNPLTESYDRHQLKMHRPLPPHVLELRLATASNDVLDSSIPIQRDLLAIDQRNSDTEQPNLTDREWGDCRYCK